MEVIRKGELFLVPERALEQGYARRLKPHIYAGLQQAIRNLRQLPPEQVEFRSADISLLPEGLQVTGDHHALAVALGVTEARPTLITHNIHLVIAGQLVGVTAMTPAAFLHRREMENQESSI